MKSEALSEALEKLNSTLLRIEIISDVFPYEMNRNKAAVLVINAASDELRRLHDENARLIERAKTFQDTHNAVVSDNDKLSRVNQDLLESLEIILDTKPSVCINIKEIAGGPHAVEWNVHTIAREAITTTKVKICPHI